MEKTETPPGVHRAGSLTFAAFMEEIFGELIFPIVGYVLRTPGALILWLLGGCKQDFSHYTDPDNYGYLPHCIGLVFMSTFIGLIFHVN